MKVLGMISGTSVDAIDVAVADFAADGDTLLMTPLKHGEVPWPDTLRDELLGQRYEILTAMAALAGVKGSLDMRIEVREMEFKLKPIKLEDRIAHIQKVMPELVYMQKALDMDFE